MIERSLIEILRERDKVLEGMKHDRDKLRKHKFDRLDTSLIKITAKDVSFWWTVHLFPNIPVAW